MGLSKHRIGQLIKVVDERNCFEITDFYGININKEFMPTVANTEGLDETSYKVVRKNRFVFSGMQTGRDECIRISMYTKDNPIIISPASSFADWLNNQIVRDQLKFDIKVCLIKNGYPPQYSPEVFQKVMEQVENFEENNG